MGFSFAFYHHTYPGGKQKERNKSETLKLWRQERNIFPNAEENVDFLTEKIKFWTQISMKVPKRASLFLFFQFHPLSKKVIFDAQEHWA